jgi:adenylosuccinate synthase
MEIPFEFNTMEIKPVLHSYEGWKTDLAGCKSYAELPERLRNYLEAIEELTGVNIMAVSISPDRKDVLYK